MPTKIRKIYKGSKKNTYLTETGSEIIPPKDWALLLPGDAVLTKAVKKETPYWKIEIKKGHRIYSGGIWAPEKIIRKIRQNLEKIRNKPEYLKKREYEKKRKNRIQNEYVNSFNTAVIDFLAFHPRYQKLSIKLAREITEYTTPVGSGTVARTKTIQLEERVEAAVIAWMRHKTTDYDTMKIKRVKGERRRIRRELAVLSKSVLDRYRNDEDVDVKNCALFNALKI